jgi:alpha-L-arabinofuranosidase
MKRERSATYRCWTRSPSRRTRAGVTLLAVNRGQAAPTALEVDVRSLPSLSAASHVAMPDDDPDAVNTLSSPDRVVPKTLDDPNSTAVACRPCCRRCAGT